MQEKKIGKKVLKQKKIEKHETLEEDTSVGHKKIEIKCNIKKRA